MPVTVNCQCGNTDDLKDVYGGRSVKCPKCGTVNVAPPAPPVAADPAFARDKFLLRQKAMAIKQKYYVWDERGNVILYVERPYSRSRRACSRRTWTTPRTWGDSYAARWWRVISSRSTVSHG